MQCTSRHYAGRDTGDSEIGGRFDTSTGRYPDACAGAHQHARTNANFNTTYHDTDDCTYCGPGAGRTDKTEGRKFP